MFFQVDSFHWNPWLGLAALPRLMDPEQGEIPARSTDNTETEAGRHDARAW
jgi:hypothetical protein